MVDATAGVWSITMIFEQVLHAHRTHRTSAAQAPHKRSTNAARAAQPLHAHRTRAAHALQAPRTRCTSAARARHTRRTRAADSLHARCARAARCTRVSSHGPRVQVLFGCVGASYTNITMAVFLTCHLASRSLQTAFPPTLASAPTLAPAPTLPHAPTLPPAPIPSHTCPALLPTSLSHTPASPPPAFRRSSSRAERCLASGGSRWTRCIT